MSKRFSDSGVGKILWKIGDTFKGKTAVGKIIKPVLDPILEIAPVPNPFRYAEEQERRSKLQALSADPGARSVASEIGVNLDDLLDTTPLWVKPVLAGLVMVVVIYLVSTGTLEPEVLERIARAIFGGS